MIYFILDTTAGLVKIGYSNKPHRRMTMLQTGSASPLEMLAIMEGEATAEAALHVKFKHRRVRGEWFRLAGPIEGFLQAERKAGRVIKTPKSRHGELTRISNATGISINYLSEIRAGNRAPPIVMAKVYLGAGVKFGALADYTDAECAVWARLTIALADKLAVAREAA